MTEHPSYAGIGSRSTPANVLSEMAAWGWYLEGMGYILRSGGAAGADTAFELNVPPAHKDIYLPWKGFNGHTSSLYPPSPEAMEVAAEFHPNWAACSRVARLFHARNSHQILGQDLCDPVKFVICWTQGGLVAGGTGQALRIASAYSIPIINLGA